MGWFATLWLATGVLWAPTVAQHATSTQTLFEHLAGHWVLRGVIGGKQTVHDVDADLVLNRGYVRLHEVSREKNANGAPAYEAFVVRERRRVQRCL